jgi:hypothetical protein
MTGYIFIALAAVFNACMDCFENEPNFNESIFKAWNKRFWCKDISWQYAKKIGGFKFDSWHIAKSLMVISLAVALCFDYRGNWWVIMLNVGLVWNLTFTTFYHFVFGIK